MPANPRSFCDGSTAGACAIQGVAATFPRKRQDAVTPLHADPHLHRWNAVKSFRVRTFSVLRMKKFSPHLEILPASQRQLWNELNQVPGEFTLYEGTAIALQLGHRQSVDFDFFGNRSFDPAKLQAAIPFVAEARVRQHERNMAAFGHLLFYALNAAGLLWWRRREPQTDG